MPTVTIPLRSILTALNLKPADTNAIKLKGALTEKLFGKQKPMEEPKMKMKIKDNDVIIDSDLNDVEVKKKLGL